MCIESCTADFATTLQRLSRYSKKELEGHFIGRDAKLYPASSNQKSCSQVFEYFRNQIERGDYAVFKNPIAREALPMALRRLKFVLKSSSKKDQNEFILFRQNVLRNLPRKDDYPFEEAEKYFKKGKCDLKFLLKKPLITLSDSDIVTILFKASQINPNTSFFINLEKIRPLSSWIMSSLIELIPKIAFRNLTFEKASYNDVELVNPDNQVEKIYINKGYLEKRIPKFPYNTKQDVLILEKGVFPFLKRWLPTILEPEKTPKVNFKGTLFKDWARDLKLADEFGLLTLWSVIDDAYNLHFLENPIDELVDANSYKINRLKESLLYKKLLLILPWNLFVKSDQDYVLSEGIKELIATIAPNTSLEDFLFCHTSRRLLDPQTRSMGMCQPVIYGALHLQEFVIFNFRIACHLTLHPSDSHLLHLYHHSLSNLNPSATLKLMKFLQNIPILDRTIFSLINSIFLVKRKDIKTFNFAHILMNKVYLSIHPEECSKLILEIYYRKQNIDYFINCIIEFEVSETLLLFSSLLHSKNAYPANTIHKLLIEMLRVNDGRNQKLSQLCYRELSKVEDFKMLMQLSRDDVLSILHEILKNSNVLDMKLLHGMPPGFLPLLLNYFPKLNVINYPTTRTRNNKLTVINLSTNKKLFLSRYLLALKIPYFAAAFSDRFYDGMINLVELPNEYFSFIERYFPFLINSNLSGLDKALTFASKSEEGLIKCFQDLCVANYFNLKEFIYILEREYLRIFNTYDEALIEKNRISFQKYFEENWEMSSLLLEQMNHSPFYKFLSSRKCLPSWYAYYKIPTCAIS